MFLPVIKEKGRIHRMSLKSVSDDSGTKQVFVCGAGHQGLSMAAHLALCGVKVTLWNRTLKNIEEVALTRKIYCRGIVNGCASIDKASSDISEVVTDFVMVTVPSNAHRDIAKELAPFVHKNMVVILNPGRTFGAIEFADCLRQNGAKEIPRIAETQTIVYTCRKEDVNCVNIYALKKGVKIAALKREDSDYIAGKLPDCLKPHFVKADSVAITSLSNVGMVLHCAPVLMNVGWIETEKADFKYYYDGISESIAKFLEKIDSERIAVAKAVGFEVESTADWLKRIYQVKGSNLFECIQNNTKYREIDAPDSLNCRYILEDIPGGMVPIEYLGVQTGISTINISIVIDLANAIMNRDFRKEGRRFSLQFLQKYFGEL